MASGEKKAKREKNGISKISKDIDTSLFQWTDHITEIDLSHKNITIIAENTEFPPNLYTIDLSYNSLKQVPAAVLNLTKLKVLILSYNEILYFDDTPCFCQTIEKVNLAHNNLEGPPYWVWAESNNLVELNLSNNINITGSFNNGYLCELIQYESPVFYVNISNCTLRDVHKPLLGTFQRAKTLELGTPNASSFSNYVGEIPFVGLENCCDIERLRLCNTHIFNVKSSIDMYKNLVEIDLSQNCLRDLPNEFCNLENLEICLLSCNYLIYLPDDMFKLKKLVRLHVDSNELCMLPNCITELKNLQYLDLYDNGLYEVPNELRNLQEIDLALNNFDEPEDAEYVEKKEKLRLGIKDRYDGRKTVMERPESEHSCNDLDDEELLRAIAADNNKDSQDVTSPPDPPSSPEDWDSDDYWVPCYTYSRHITPPPHSPWLYFVKRKMAEGNFCPMDAHSIPVIEQVKYQKMCNPQRHREVPGQFDDYSEDDS